jgi:DNA mismatch repair protein MutL
VPQMVRAVNDVDLHEGQQVAPWLKGEDNQFHPCIYGLIGLPDRCHRPRADWVKVAVNGRLVTVPELEQSVVQAFRQTLPRHR